jgi:uncharacterized protein YkwD
MLPALSRRLTTIIAVAAALGLAAPAAAQARCPHAGKTPVKLSLTKARNAILCLVNQRRRINGVRELRRNDRLGRSSLKHSRNMNGRNFFSHTGPNGSSPLSRISRSGYLSSTSSWGIGETIRWGARRRGTPRNTVRLWMRSGGHRDTLLRGSFRHIGIGVAFGSPLRAGRARNSAIYTVDLGYRR